MIGDISFQFEFPLDVYARANTMCGMGIQRARTTNGKIGPVDLSKYENICI